MICCANFCCVELYFKHVFILGRLYSNNKYKWFPFRNVKGFINFRHYSFAIAIPKADQSYTFHLISNILELSNLPLQLSRYRMSCESIHSRLMIDFSSGDELISLSREVPYGVWRTDNAGGSCLQELRWRECRLLCSSFGEFSKYAYERCDD